MKKRSIVRILASFCLTAIMLSFCGCGKEKKLSRTYWDLFDTFAQISAFTKDEGGFDSACALASSELERCHRIFDIYNEYDGLNNAATVNRFAGKAPVTVPQDLIDLADFAVEMYYRSGGAVNIAMGSVLSLWHECRSASEPKLPDATALKAAAEHCDISAVIIDHEQSTIFLADPLMRLDLGAIAKGWAVERAAKALEDAGFNGFAVNVGGNLRVTGDKPDGSGWSAGVQDPFGSSEPTAVVTLHREALATSGTYQRYFELNGVRYHHIIDPDTLYPATGWQSVSVLAADAGLADCLSTALFNLSLEDGLALIGSFDGVEAFWISDDGSTFSSGQFK